ncbi:MAG: M20 family metallopeptidase [Sulfolobales archaeon]
MEKDYLNYAIDLLKELISIPSINPPGESYKEISVFLERRLREIGFETRLIEVPEEYMDKWYPYKPLHRGYPRYIVYGGFGGGRPIIQFNGHYDVVPPGTGWSRDPFKAYVEGDKIFGRGSTDMKGGIATVIAALKYVIEKELVSRGRVEVVFVPDEESGGVGTRYFVESGISAPDYVIIAEPTTFKRINIGHKGLVRGVVKVLGKQVHGSVPWKGRNAFLDAAKLALRFQEIYEKILRERSTAAPVDEEEAKHPTINLGGYAESTSKKDNIVPGEFLFSFDRRVIPEEDIELVSREIIDLFSKLSKELGIESSVEILSKVPASMTRGDSLLVKRLSKCINEIHGVEPLIRLSYGRDDTVYYRQAGIDAVTYGPGVEGTAHMPDEYTSISDIERVLRTYICLLKDLLYVK